MEDFDAFVRRLRNFSREDQLKIQKAYHFAKEFHRQQLREEKRDGVPVRYFEHPREATIILLDEVGIHDADIICAELLHDVLEDSKRASVEKLYVEFGARVALFVTQVTKFRTINENDFHEKQVRDWLYLDRLANDSLCESLIVKFGDRVNNIRTVQPDKRQKQIDETEKKYFSIADRMVEIAPSSLEKQALRLRDLVHHVVRQAKALEVVAHKAQ